MTHKERALPHSPLRPGMIDVPHRRAALGDYALESGETIRDFELSYVTHGELNEQRDNAVLVTVSLTGNHHRLDFLIGPGKALDTERYFVVCVDAIGNGLSSSPSNSVTQPGMAFPRFGVRDMVHSQLRLLRDEMGLTLLHAVVGASMGGMQALQWAVSYGNFVRAIVAMTPMARTAPWAVAVVETARRALMADPAWDGSSFTGYPARGWRAWSGVMSVLAGRSPAALEEMFDHPLEALAWMDKVTADNRAGGFDATDWLYQSWAYEAHDVGTTPGFDGNTAAALATISARTLILAPALDLFNPAHCAHAAADAIPEATLVEIPSVQGHQAAGTASQADAAFLNEEIGAFLGSVSVSEAS
jgi:homoserine O-acetyltransferase/O-succinyltransferase